MALTKVTKELIQGGLGLDWQATVQTGNFQAVASQGYFVDTTSNTVSVTLPVSPAVGDIIGIVDYAGTAQTNRIIITAQANINGSSNDVQINYQRGAVNIVYSGSAQGWIADLAANEGTEALIDFPPPVTFSVDFLVVAGGGGAGAWLAGGAGGGGVRTSYGSIAPGSTGSVESAQSITTYNSYTVTVGEGAPGPAAQQGVGTKGSDSVFDSITSKGGAGSSASSHSYTTLNNGSGSGGGIGRGASGNWDTAQGFNGGAGGNGNLVSNSATGGGGGAGAAGTAGTGSYNSSTGVPGNGGDGIYVNILNATNATSAQVGEVSGSNVYYGGGGAGAVWTSGYTATGGLGGGADYDYNTYGEGNSGTPNTGGGAAGNGYVASSNGPTGVCAGGRGVIILRYPSARILTAGSNLTQATGSPFTEGSDKVSVFISGSDTITFN